MFQYVHVVTKNNSKHYPNVYYEIITLGGNTTMGGSIHRVTSNHIRFLSRGVFTLPFLYMGFFGKYTNKNTPTY
jgi:hypothetical protein